MKKSLYFFSSFTTLFLLLCMFGCENPPGNYEPEPNVYCLLRTDQDSVYVLVGLSARLTDTLSDTAHWWNGVAGASVKIDDVYLKEEQDFIGRYVTNSLKTEAAKTYSLEVKYPDGMIVQGKTTVPDSFSIFSVRIDTTIDVDTLVVLDSAGRPIDTIIEEEEQARVTFSWEESKEAKGYFTTGKGSYMKENSILFYSLQPYFQRSTTDTIWFPTEIRNDEELYKLVSAKIQVWAVDENYNDYCAYWWHGWETGIDSTGHLEGGLGVFGSACVTEWVITFPP